MSRRRKFWLGLFVLLLAPVLVLLAFALYVHLANAQPQSGPLQTKVSPQVVMPWGEATYYIEFAGIKPAPTPAPVASVTPAPTPTPAPSPQPIDMVFVVDESSSMTSFIGDMANAAQSVVQDLAAERKGRIQYAAIRFDVVAEIQTEWTDKPDVLINGLNAIAQSPQGRGTNGSVAFEKLGELLHRARPNADKVVIFYTDGLICPDADSEQYIIDMASDFRNKQNVEFYSVGLPYQGSAQVMTEITADPTHVFDPSNPADLAKVFQELKVVFAPPDATAKAKAPGPTPAATPRSSSGQLSHRIDGRHFATPLQGTNWMLGGGALNLAVKPVPQTDTTYAHPLVPLSAGLWRIGTQPPQFVFYDQQGRHMVAAERRPLLLKITYLTLFLMVLPGLLWTAAHLIPIRGPVKKVDPGPLVLPDPIGETYPEPLPLLPRLTVDPLVPVPTLFVGLGGAGRRALHAIRADLKQSHLGAADQPYSFLWLDSDTQETERELPFEDWENYAIEEVIAPPVVRQVDGYLPEPGRVQDHLQWFNPHTYRDASRARLNLSDGAKGERSLARLALFNWLSRSDSLVATLAEQVKKLAGFTAKDGTRQIVVIASADGGVGTGWFLDLGRLFQRLARDQENLEALPDVVGVLCQDRDLRHPENQRALSLEIETAQAARKFPQRITFAPNDRLLDQRDTHSPYHWIFSAKAGDKNSVAAQCGELISLLIERQPRARLLDQAQNVSPGGIVGTNAYGAHVLPTIVFEQVKCELFLRILGPDVLLDVTEDVQGGLRPQPITAERANDLLRDWSQRESRSPFQLLLAAACDPAALTAFVSSIPSPAPELKDWFTRAFTQSLTRQLQGQAVGDGAWERNCKPAEAVAVLRLLSSQLSRSVKPQVTAAHVVEIVDHVGGLASSSADDVERWLLEFCHECELVAAQRNRLEQARRSLLSLERRVYIRLDVEAAQIERWAQEGLQSWLGTPDTKSAIRQRLFFTMSGDGANVMSYIDQQPRRYESAHEVATAMDHLTNSLALHVPALRISGVLARISSERRRELAQGMAPIENRPDQVLLVMPQAVGLGSEDGLALEQFEKAVPKPPAHGPRVTQHGDDHSAVRRVELASPLLDGADGQLTFVEMTESLAEAVRSRAERRYEIGLPIFPARLRLALAHQDAFLSFARAYKSGHIVQRADARGREQWTVDGQFLTFENESSLAHAAANFARDLDVYPEWPADGVEQGSFAELQKWLHDHDKPNPDTLTQIAIEVSE